MAGKSILKRICVLHVSVRAMPENKKPPALRENIYYKKHIIFKNVSECRI